MSRDRELPNRDETGDPSELEPAMDPAGEAHVRALLAQHADPGPMPSDIALRLDAALAAASADTAPDHQLVGTRSGGTRSVRRRRLARVPGGLLAVAATGAVLLGGVAIGLSELGSAGGQDMSTAAGGTGSNDSESGEDQAARSSAEQSGADTSAEANAAQEDAGEAAAGALPGTINTSGRDYDLASLPGAAALLLAGSPEAPLAGSAPGLPTGPDRPPTPSAPLAAPLPASIERLRDASTLGICARALAGGGPDQVLAADLARYQGEPAAVIVLPGPTAAEVDVWVVGPGCAPGDQQVLARQRIPRP